VDLEELVELLRRAQGVEEAYVDPPGEDPSIDPSDDDWFPHQGYLKPAPDGIDAKYAWGFVGGAGQLQHFIDMEEAGRSITRISRVTACRTRFTGS
jgi:hypothetical protein